MSSGGFPNRSWNFNRDAASVSEVASLHAALLLWLPACRLILELLPCLRRLVILPVDHVRVNLLRRPYRPMPQARRYRRQRYECQSMDERFRIRLGHTDIRRV
jgi:hypothetical protein